MPFDELARLAALARYDILDSAPEQAYDDLTELAAYICDTPVSLVSLVGSSRQFFKSARNLPLSETSRELSFCAHTLQTARTLVVEDATQDARFAENDLVTGNPHICFYAGAPIVTHDGHVLGSVCVIDTKPRQLTAKQISSLEALARQATELLEQRRLNLEQQRAADVLNKAIAHLEQAASAGKLGIFTWIVTEDKVVWENDLMFEIYGRSRSEGPFGAAYFAEHVVHPAYRESLLEVLATIRKPGDRLYWMGQFLHSNGSFRWVEFQGLADETPDGELFLIGTTSDATQQKELEEHLTADRERLRLALSSTQATSFEWQLTDDSIRWDGPLPFGLRPDDLPDSASVFKLIHPDDTAGLRRAIEEALAGRLQYSHEFRATWPDGSTHWIRGRGKVTWDEAGVPIGMIGINVDVTDRKLSEQALLQTEKLAAVGRLASTISHEINNPLEAVTNVLFIMRASPGLTQIDRDYLEIADRELARIGQVTAQTLRFHRNVTRANCIEVSELIADTLALYQSRLAASSIDVRVQTAGGVRFEGFEADIRQVLNNLLRNSFDVMRLGGTLQIRARFSTEWHSMRPGVVVTVADSGSGIPRESQVHIFQEFFSTKGIHGTGLGLWISKRIIHKHRGHLSFRSKVGEPHGSVFRVWLPLQAAPTAGDAWALS